jgi:hypothetical protein
MKLSKHLKCTLAVCGFSTQWHLIAWTNRRAWRWRGGRRRRLTLTGAPLGEDFSAARANCDIPSELPMWQRSPPCICVRIYRIFTRNSSGPNGQIRSLRQRAKNFTYGAVRRAEQCRCRAIIYSVRANGPWAAHTSAAIVHRDASFSG